MRILIIKIGALGDVLRTSFIAQALKDKYKNKNPEVFWITSPTAEHLLSNNPYIDEIIFSEEKSKIKNIEFDLIINLEEDKDNTSFASSIDSNKKIGFLIKDGEVFPTKTAEEWFNMSLLGKKPENDILKSHDYVKEWLSSHSLEKASAEARQFSLTYFEDFPKFTQLVVNQHGKKVSDL